MDSAIRPRLLAMRDTLASLSAARCGLYHEVARFDASLPFPLVPTATPERYSSPLFCPIDQRAGRLPCAHSTARRMLLRAIELLGELRDDQGEPLLLELNVVEAEIGRLDHAMSDTAKEADRLRRIIEAGEDSADDATLADALQRARKQITGIAAEHNRCAERIDGVRNRLMARIDAAIGDGEIGDVVTTETMIGEVTR